MNLEEWFTVNHMLMYQHKYSYEDLMSWIPWEREVYGSMIIKDIREEIERLRSQRN